MKKSLKLGLFLAFISLPVFAAKVPLPPENKPDLELTCDEADARIEAYTNRVNGLSTNLENIKKEVAAAEGELARHIENQKKCEEDILRIMSTFCGYTVMEPDLESYRQKLGVLEGKVRQMRTLSNDELADRRVEVVQLDNECNELCKDKLSIIPEFYDRINALKRDIKGLYRERNISGYKVGTWAQDKDCLWNIAGKMEIYGNPFQWPKIWQANTKIIRNPDIIYPGQILQIPPPGPKTDAETRAERKYHRDRNAAEQGPTAGQ